MKKEQDDSGHFPYLDKFDIGFLIISLSVSFYLVGIGYQAGYLEVFGLDSEMFLRENYRLLLDGFYCIFQLFILLVMPVMIVGFLFLIRESVVSSAPKMAVRISRCSTKYLDVIVSPFKAYKNLCDNKLLMLILFPLGVMYFVVCLPFLILLVFLGGHRKKMKADLRQDQKLRMEKSVEKFSYVFLILFLPGLLYGWGAVVGDLNGKSMYLSASSVTLSLLDVEYKNAKRIACSETRCAFMVDRKKVIVLQNDQIKSIGYAAINSMASPETDFSKLFSLFIAYTNVAD